MNAKVLQVFQQPAKSATRVVGRLGSKAKFKLVKWLKRGLVLGFVLMLATACQVFLLNWVTPPTTMPMVARWISKRFASSVSTPNECRWIEMKAMPEAFLSKAWISEDHKFFSHNGFDWEEIQKARDEAKATGMPARGASTITQQCARSLFLWQGRSWVRKGLEAYYTVLMELMLSKQRIFELYANVIELGDGIYGIEAAAQHYYSVPAAQLTSDQAAMLVAIMPNPRQWDPLLPCERVLKRQKIILDRSLHVYWPLECFNGTNQALK